MRKQGNPEFEYSVLESSDTEQQGQVEEKRSVAVLRRTPGLISGVSQEANLGASRSVFKKAGKRMKIRSLLRS